MFANNPSDICAAGKGNFIDVGVHKGRAGFAVACDDIHDACWHASLRADFAKYHGCHRCELGGFQHDRVPHRQRGRDFPCEHQQREIPWDYLATHAKRVAIGQFVVHQLGHTRVIIEMADRKRYIDVAGFADRFAVIQRLHHRQKT